MVLLYHYEASYRYRSLDASESVTTAHCPQLIYEVSFGQTVLSFVVITSPITQKKNLRICSEVVESHIEICHH